MTRGGLVARGIVSVEPLRLVDRHSGGGLEASRSKWLKVYHRFSLGRTQNGSPQATDKGPFPVDAP